jgi:hypothetical protein
MRLSSPSRCQLSSAWRSAIAILAAGTHGAVGVCVADGVSVAGGAQGADDARAMVGVRECTTDGGCRPP